MATTDYLRLVCLAACLDALPGLAAPTVWQGEAIITTATAACRSSADPRRRVAVGSVLKSVLRPKLIGTNGNDTRISFVHDAQVMFAAILAGGSLPSGTYTAFGIDQSGSLRANVGSAYEAFRLTPQSPTAATLSLALTGRMDDFLYLPGCTASFRAGYTLRE